MIDVHNIVKAYDSVIAVDGASFNVNPGEIFGLIGPNGAGKTTTIRMIMNILAPDSGSISIDGKPLTEADKARVGYLPEERGLYKKMKVGDMLAFLAEIKGADRLQSARRADDWLRRFGILEWKSRKVEELSKGMAQKVQFIGTVAHDPDVLLFDEPFSGLDPVSQDLLLEALLELKQAGFSDKKIGSWRGKTEFQIRALRKGLNILPSVFAIDTLGGEMPAKTNYLYLTYHGAHHDVSPLRKKAIIVLGSGPYHIGSSVEFDWSSVHAALALKRYKRKSVIINCNPETVSTDYDMSDRLYFENLSFETVADIFEFENAFGLILSVGGQRPNNLAKELAAADFHILGTAAKDIDRAENRNAFSALLDELGILQPKWQSFISMTEALKFTKAEGFPVLVRPSYVLSGSAMRVCYNKKQLFNFVNKAAVLSPLHPVTVSKYIENAKELEFDGVAEKGKVVIYGISEHVENAGVHSGDATIVYPTQRVYASTEFQLRQISKKIVRALSVTGPFNIQFLVKDNKPFVIEVNLRASRTFPFISKAMDANFPEIAVDSFFGKAQAHNFIYPTSVLVKSPQFSFARLLGADPVLRVEMSSTGEAACFGRDYDEALLKSILSTNKFDFGNKNVLLSLGGEVNKAKFLEAARILLSLGYTIFATDTTAAFLEKQNIKCRTVRKAYQESPNALDIILGKKVSFVVNLSKMENASGAEEGAGHTLTDGFRIRRAAVDNQIPLFTDLHLARAFIKALAHYGLGDLEIKSYKEYI